MKEETEVIFHRDIENDESAKVRHHDDDDDWMVESYEARTTQALLDEGATQLPSRTAGKLFKVDAKQLILFIAESSGLNVEFRARKRQQLTPEKAEARRQRMAAMNAAQRAKV